MKYVIFTTILIGSSVLGAFTFIQSGLISVAADEDHSVLTHWLINQVRESAIERAAQEIVVPPLGDPSRIILGGQDYNAMCTGCHLKPGKDSSDISLGLNPKAPNLVLGESHLNAQVSEQYLSKRQFWIIKHGVMASGMPAWGPTHDDERIWNMVAFIQQLPNLSKTQYQVLTASKSKNNKASHH